METIIQRERADCTVRAFSDVTKIPYEEVLSGFSELGRKHNCGIFIGNKTRIRGNIYKVKKKHRIDINDIENKFNVNFKMVARSGTANRLIKKHPIGNFYCLKTGHAFGIVDGKITDGTSIFSQLEYAWEVVKR